MGDWFDDPLAVLVTACPEFIHYVDTPRVDQSESYNASVLYGDGNLLDHLRCINVDLLHLLSLISGLEDGCLHSFRKLELQREQSSIQ